MSKIKILSIAVIGLLLFNAAIVGFLIIKKPPHLLYGRPPIANEGPKEVIIERLNLNGEQITAYDKLITAHRTSIKVLDDSLSELRYNLYQSLIGITSAREDSIVIRLGEIHQQIELTTYNHFVALKNLCRPDQLDKFNKLTIELADFFARKNNVSPPEKN